MCGVDIIFSLHLESGCDLDDYKRNLNALSIRIDAPHLLGLCAVVGASISPLEGRQRVLTWRHRYIRACGDGCELYHSIELLLHVFMTPPASYIIVLKSCLYLRLIEISGWQYSLLYAARLRVRTLLAPVKAQSALSAGFLPL